jgi:hypothetical protein
MMDPTGETNKAITYQNIRLMQVSNTFASSEQQELSGISTAWSAPNNRNGMVYHFVEYFPIHVFHF